jgi:hypothetical protein
MTLAASTARGLYLAGFCAGLAAGLRSQVAWLTVPLLALRAFQGLGTGRWGLGGLRAEGSGLSAEGSGSGALRLQPLALRLRPLALSLLLFLTGVAFWLVPLVIVSGGPAAYAHALFDQGAEDLGNIQMLWTRHGVRDVLDALYYALVAPWARGRSRPWR